MATKVVGKLDWRTIFDAKPDASPELLAALDKHFEPFAELGDPKERICLNCNKNLRVEWGLQHGEANCIECGWPCRLYHYIKNESGEEIATLRGIATQYHPDFVTTRASK